MAIAVKWANNNAGTREISEVAGHNMIAMLVSACPHCIHPLKTMEAAELVRGFVMPPETYVRFRFECVNCTHNFIVEVEESELQLHFCDLQKVIIRRLVTRLQTVNAAQQQQQAALGAAVPFPRHLAHWLKEPAPAPVVCPDCNGTRQYVGLFETGPCRTCQPQPIT